MAHVNRPLSPHLDVYRWQWSNTLSIVHRFSGVMLTAGALVLTFWLASLAAGPGAYETVIVLLRSPVGLLLLVAWTFCFFYHLCNGIRHLAWDVGYGFEISQARKSGMLVLAAALVLTAGTWLAALAGMGG
jgi:succinate dehydrogenase / fumarate reductase cytochrome b subunit